MHTYEIKNVFTTDHLLKKGKTVNGCTGNVAERLAEYNSYGLDDEETYREVASCRVYYMRTAETNMLKNKKIKKFKIGGGYQSRNIKDEAAKLT